ncbi:succinoglycan biosynthesis protein ExoI [Sinorhizobium sp. KGO-5]|uniref:thermonuclease family protein n=1 Tax=Sinorhizobium sp. KGO-5 TaxID=1470810 RepID=UPI00294A1CAD|nr:succinoglycan biosynthesis protein ExoI [Sinorhizobium sp. KGO-5]
MKLRATWHKPSSFPRTCSDKTPNVGVCSTGYNLLRLDELASVDWRHLALLLIAHSTFAADPITGRATVRDGDTIEIQGERIRMHGVDAPESWQKCENADGSSYRCGREAAQELARFIAESRPTRCEFVERDQYKRFVGVCFRADGRDVNRWLVESGNAVDWTRYSNGAYANAQERARSHRAGIWRGNFELPCNARPARAKRGASC